MPVFILFLLILIATPSFNQTMEESLSQVWQVGDRRWTIEEEQNYSQWVETNITEDFFIRYKIPIDCADVPYAIRWIYARIAHLPAAATTKEGQFIGHWSKEWKDLPTHSEWHKDLRFRKALLHMLQETIWIWIDISKDRSITFYHIYQNHLWFSPHPEDSVEARWGLKKCEMILSQIRSAKNSIAFIERTYRKKDPKYSSFALQQQQEILRRLSEEWDRSQCKKRNSHHPRCSPR